LPIGAVGVVIYRVTELMKIGIICTVNISQPITSAQTGSV